ncbi:helix-turn-helix transcriptional regulator [Tessaracoccus defluvii]|uniref:Helix-turn-helix transcriptional regulator n=1 Tax=Tessaracoccus defluvii TaxID=1285901 RepID=A0A7H0H470_9ACTN|nr:helix-turn-helix transcriptional regulator [Tessaracoccus defluvii]
MRYTPSWLRASRQSFAYGHDVTPHATPARFGLIVRGRREALGLTQAEVAERCAVTRTYVSALENGHKNPTLETQVRIATALGVELSALVKEAEEKR